VVATGASTGFVCPTLRVIVFGLYDRGQRQMPLRVRGWHCASAASPLFWTVEETGSFKSETAVLMKEPEGNDQVGNTHI
jgi:hypothetical protein